MTTRLLRFALLFAFFGLQFMTATRCTAMTLDSTQYGWHELSPSVDLGQPWNIYAAGNNAYILCDGFLAHSADGGTTWSRFDLPGCFSPRAGAFQGDSIGVVVGDGGTVYKTTDAGKSWRQRPTAFTAIDLRHVTFATPSVVYASGGFGLVLMSTDAGDTWSYPGYIALYSFDTYSCVKPVSENELWMMRVKRLGASQPGASHNKQLQLMLSMDAGNTWSTIGGPWPYGPDPDDERVATDFARDFSSFRVCGLAGASFTVKLNGVWKTISTTNTGQSWDTSTVAVNDPMRYPNLFDCKSGWATNYSGDRLFRSLPGDSGRWIGRTTPSTGGVTYLYNFLDTNRGLCMVKTASVAAVYRTTDGGGSWIMTFGTPLNFNGAMTAVSFVSANDGFTIARDPAGWSILGTTDGGSNWRTLSRDTRLRNLAGIQFLTASNGWVYGDSVFFTTDGGTSWRASPQLPLDPLRPFVHYTRVQFVDRQIGWAIRSDWQTYRTTDAGVNWQEVHSRDTAVNITIATVLNRATLLAMGTVSDVPYEFRLIDSGTFSQQAPLDPTGNTPTLPVSIYFLDSLTGWYADSTPNIYFTIDGGVIWTFMLSQDLKPVKGLFFRDTSEGWLLKAQNIKDSLALSAPAIFRLTETGGRATRDQCLFRNLNAMTFLGDTLGWAVGDNNVVYRYYSPNSLRIPRKPIMVVSLPLIDFGVVKINAQRSLPFTVYNRGNDTLHIYGAEIQNDQLRGFQIGTILPKTVDPGDSVKINMIFYPTYLLNYHAVLQVFSNADTQHLSLFGVCNQVGVNEGSVISADGFALQGYPNPFRSSTALTVNGPGGWPAGATVKIYDALGREVADLTEEFRHGASHVMFLGDRLPAGRYMATMQSRAGRAVQPLILVH